jgi:hypothetical protein
MLVKFSSTGGATVSMFEKDAKQLIEMLGHSGSIPGAINAEDIPVALQKMEDALRIDEQEKAEDDCEDSHAIHGNVRAFPLIELLKNAHAKNKSVMWEYDQSFF